MIDVLFSNAYFYPLDSKQWKAKQPYPPLGTIYAAAWIREKGFSVSLFDSNLIENPSEIEQVLERKKPKYLVIYEDGFNYLSKMCLLTMRKAAFQIIQIAKTHNCKVIVNSSDATDHYENYLAQEADFVILGEGELTLSELLETLERENGNFESITGLAFRKDEKAIKNPPRKILKDLDSLPIPAWDLVDIAAYQKIWLKYQGYFSLNIATTRGCPYKCNWCAKPIYGNRYNSRSPEKVSEEIEFLIQNYQVNHFWICDDIFGLKPNWVQQFRDIVKEKKLKFKYKIQSRVDLLLKAETVEALAESGLDLAWVGAESGSQKILDAMDKGTSIEQIYQANELLKEKGIKRAFFIQFGYLGEEKADIDKTIQMVLDLMPDDIGVSVSYPLPGTGFYEKVKVDLKEKANWTDSDDLAMLFHNTYSPAYYKRLHRYLHKLYRRKKAKLQLLRILESPFSINFQKIKSLLGVIYYSLGATMDYYKLKKLQTGK